MIKMMMFKYAHLNYLVKNKTKRTIVKHLTNIKTNLSQVSFPFPGGCKFQILKHEHDAAEDESEGLRPVSESDRI